MRVVMAAAALLALACAGDAARPLALRIEPGVHGTRLRLLPAPGWRINAFLPPAFERPDGSVVRFGGAALSADSAYYLVPPSAVLPGVHPKVEGTLRASICAEGEQVCRPYVEAFGS